ncbi:hypothetical protein I4U23_002765 [Adineta vaga]|nr:hypothetical protein I4U23_002765 [Adineta vaga]
MNHLHKNDLLDETTTNLFDPFAPTTISPSSITTTTASKTSGMFDDVLIDSNDSHGKEFGMQANLSSNQPLANYNFDELWNQSMSHLTQSNNNEIQSNTDIDPNTFSWDDLVNNTDKRNSSDQKIDVPISNLTWDSLFNIENREEEKDHDLKQYLDWILSHLDSVESRIEFTSIQNLESIIKDIHMCALPFEPIPSPPLHVDHTVANPMINAIHHDLFPIDELEQPNINHAPQSMILYEEDEENQVTPAAENLVSNILQTALTEVNESNQQVEHLVDQILGQAIFEVHDEDIIQSKSDINETLPTENLASIISWHDQTKATNKQIPDPFDQKFDSVWSQHFEVPDDTTNENLFDNETKHDFDPWLTTTTEVNKNEDPMMMFSKTFDDVDLFSSTNNPIKTNQETEDDETSTFSDYIPPSILTNSMKATTAVNDLMKYTLTAPVIDDSGDDNSTFNDSFTFRKNESSSSAPAVTTADTNVDEESNGTEDITFRESNNQEDFFANNSRLSHFEAFASDQPLHSPEFDSKFASIPNQFNDNFNQSSSSPQQSTDDNAPWISVDKSFETVESNAIGDNEPWELEDHKEENLTPVPTTTRLSAFDDSEFSSTKELDSNQNFFSDSFNPPTLKGKRSNEEIDDQSGSKAVRFDDRVQNIRVPTPPNDTFDESKLSTKGDSNDIEIDDITPSFQTDLTESNYTIVTKRDAKETITLPSESENLPSPAKTQMRK